MVKADGHGFQALLTGEIGDADLRAEAERLPGLEIRAGYVANEELWRCFARSSFVVMPYLSGTTSAAVHLAYAFKRPVIASDLACFRDVVIPGETGIVISKADPVALKNAIIELGNDPRRCRAMGEAGFGLETSSAYDWTTIADATVQVYLDARQRRR
jgi:glycosyltransferase involved in cell wall biosynthesis